MRAMCDEVDTFLTCTINYKKNMNKKVILGSDNQDKQTDIEERTKTISLGRVRAGIS